MNFKQFFLSYVPEVALHREVRGIKILLQSSFPHVGRFLLHAIAESTGCESCVFYVKGKWWVWSKTAPWRTLLSLS